MTATLVVLNLLMALPLLIYISAMPFARLAYDDFCSAITAQIYGLPGAALWWYNNLNGRFIAFVINSATTLMGPPLQAIYGTFLLLIWWVALFVLFLHWTHQRTNARLQAGVLASLTIVATLTALPSIAATLYWYTGTSIYLVSLVAITAYLALLMQQRFSNGLTLVLCAVLASIAAGTSDTGGLIAVTGLGLALLLTLYRPERFRPARPRLIAGLIGAGVAMGLVLAAPGNAVRVALSPTPSLAYTLQVAAASPGAPAIVAFHFAPLNSLICLLIGLLAGYFSPAAATLPVKRRARLAVIVMLVGFAVLMVLCFAPVAYFLSAGLNEHAWVTPTCLFMLLLLGAGFALGVSFKPRLTAAALPKVVQGVVIGLLAVVALNSTAYAYDAAVHQRAYAATWDARDVAIRAQVAQGGGTPYSGPFTNPYDTRIHVDPDAVPLQIDSLRQISPFKWEADGDPNTLANRCIARYYGLAAVIGTP